MLRCCRSVGRIASCRRSNRQVIRSSKNQFRRIRLGGNCAEALVLFRLVWERRSGGRATNRRPPERTSFRRRSSELFGPLRPRLLNTEDGEYITFGCKQELALSPVPA